MPAVRFTYDPLGRRALKTVGSLKTISIYDGWQCVWQKVTGSGTDTTKAYTFGNYIDEPVTQIRKWSTSTDTSYYLQGNNYNVEALTDRTGSVIERYEYTPYGKPTVYTGAGTDGKWFTSDDVSATVSAKGNALTFQGRELDAESGGYYFRYRYFAAAQGRFISRDPIRLDGADYNILRFVSGDPLHYSDPLGLKIDLAKCAEYLAQILKNTKILKTEFEWFDPITDAMGDFWVKDWKKGFGALKRGAIDEHRDKMGNLQQGIKNNLKDFRENCTKKDCDDDQDPPSPPPGALEEGEAYANKNIPTIGDFTWDILKILGPKIHPPTSPIHMPSSPGGAPPAPPPVPVL